MIAPSKSVSLEGGIGAAILEHVPSGILALDASGVVRYANRPAAALLGREADVCRGLGAATLFGADAAAEIVAPYAHGQERHLSLLLARADGTPVRAALTVILPPAGAIADVAALVVFRDLEEERLVEEDLRRFEGQAALGRIVAGLSHELRNPLAAILGLANVLVAESPTDDPSDPRLEPARRIAELVSRMERLIAACVAVGSPAPPHLGVESAAVLAERALEALSPRWGRRRPAPTLSVHPGDVRVRADAAQVVQCLRAVIENACDASGDPGGVAVEVSRHPGTRDGRARVRVEVRDAGPGVPASLLPRIFEPFYTTRPDHLGLGLAVARSLALRNGATLEGRSRPGETVFTLSLPAAGGEP